jgi:hypothetical protein
MKFIRFFYRGPGLLLVVVGGIVVIGWMIQRGAEKRQTAKTTTAKNQEVGQLHPTSSVDTSVAPKESELSKTRLTPPRTESEPVQTKPVFNAIQQPRALPTLVSFYTQVTATPPVEKPKKKTEPEQLWLPPSIFIPCALVNTVNSSHINTPVVGEVLRDIWQNKKLVIPAGTIVSSFAAGGAVRDRIEVAGSWLLVFSDGRQLKVNGIACVRQANAENEQFGPEDGSAGLLGTLEESDHWSNAKAFIALLMTSVNQVVTAGANSAVNSVSCGGYGGGVVLPDTSQIQAKYLDQLLNGQTGDGRYVHVPAGTEFAIFPLETTHPLNRSIDNSASVKEDAPPLSDNPDVNAIIQNSREIMRAGQQPPANENQTPHYKY